MYDTRLESIVAAADLGSFTKAASAVHVSTTALVKQVNGFEAENGVVIFRRGKRGVTLTEAGRELVEDARTIMRLSRHALDRARAKSHAASDAVRLGVSVLRPGTYVLEAWEGLKNTLSDVSLELVPMSDNFQEYSRTIEQLGTDIDLVVSTFPSNRWNGAVSILDLGMIPISLAIPLSYPLAQRDRISVSELAGRRVRIRERGHAWVDAARSVLEACPEITIVDAPDYDLNTFNACAQSGDILQTTGMWTNVHPGLKCVSVDWDFTIPIGLIYPREPRKAVARFVDALAERV